MSSECDAAASNVESTFPRDRISDRTTRLVEDRERRRASLRHGDVGMIRVASSRLCFRRTWHNVGMYSRKVAHGAFGVS